MTKNRQYLRKLATTAGVGLFSFLALGSFTTTVQASSHREAPSTAVDPAADGTDVYAWVDPTDIFRVNLIANFIPFQLPQGGPNFYRFDDNIVYEIKIDNNGDALDDVILQLRFKTTVSNPNTILYNTGPVTSLSDPTLNIKQFYSIAYVANGRSTALTPTTPVTGAPAGFPFEAAPPNIGARSTPNYETSLATPAIYNVFFPGGGFGRVFVGPRDDGFYIDVGSIFDLPYALRPFNPAYFIPKPAAPGVDGLAGFNVSTIAIQIPITGLTAGNVRPTSSTDPRAVVGIYATSSRRAMIAFAQDRSGTVAFSGNFVQTSRLGNPLVNETIVPLGFKDRFNASQPSDDAQFLQGVLHSEPARLIGPGDPIGPGGALVDVYPTIDTPPEPRTDIATIFLTGIPGLNVQTNTSGGPSVVAFANQPANTVPNERLRLNVAIPASPGTASPIGTANRLGFLGGDNAGFPNGRRIGDDVVDTELRVFAGATPFTPAFDISPNKDLGDGVNTNDRPFNTTFPYLASPWAGTDEPTAVDSRAVGSTNTNIQQPTPRPSPTPRP